MTPEQLSQLQQVQDEINAIPYIAQGTIAEPPDVYYDIPVAGGTWVCRMFVQAKAQKLEALGWAGNPMLLEILCMLEAPDPDAGEGHAVLQVCDPAIGSSDPDPYILDSRQQALYRRNSPPPGYAWSYIQRASGDDFVPLS
jgi:predicted transglutaminase-like cysteine proteinase